MQDDTHFLFFMSKLLLSVAAKLPFARSYLLEHKSRWELWQQQFTKERRERGDASGW
jgi:hypothetical protein